MEKLKVLDLFSGIGGFSLGLERTGGFSTVAFCEIDKFCQRVLKKHWPTVEVFKDVTRFKYRKNVDLVTAGFPCQDISLAGKCAGLAGERSGLFWYILRTLCMVGRPRALLENVAALLDSGMGTILGAMASFGYDTEWHCIPASTIGAPHKRDRLWIITNPQGKQNRRLQQRGLFGHSVNEIATNANGIGREGGFQETVSWKRRISGQFKRGITFWDSGWNLSAPRICGVDDGIPDRTHRLKSLGNAVVPQIPEIIGYAILAAEAS